MGHDGWDLELGRCVDGQGCWRNYDIPDVLQRISWFLLAHTDGTGYRSLLGEAEALTDRLLA